MIDNYENIRSKLDFSSEVFYYLQVLQRKKDNPGQSWLSKQRYSRLIKNIDDFDNTYEISKSIADFYNARVYVDLSAGSLEKLSLNALRVLATRVCDKSYSDIYKVFDKLAPLNEVKVKDIKRWMIDLDYKKDTEGYNRVLEYLKNNIDIFIIGEIETLNGVHIILPTFNYVHAFKSLEVVDNDRNYKLSTGETFGLKLDCNTLLYYGK